jgi:hypothetical protein
VTPEKGLASLPEPEDVVQQSSQPERVLAGKEASKTMGPSLSFSSSKGRLKPPPGKRKAPSDPDRKDSGNVMGMPAKKKPKKPSKTLLSFGDDA